MGERKQVTMTHAEWLAEAERRFGSDALKWRFECPSCGHVASVADWKNAGAGQGEVAFSCIGRRIGGRDAFGEKGGGPCNYAGGGLFAINPVTVEFENGENSRYFSFADADVSHADG